MLQDPDWEPEVRDGLDAMIRRHGVGGPDHDGDAPPIAALDFDDTCLGGDISEMALAVLERESGASGLVAAYEEECRRDLRAAYVELVHTLVAGRTPDQVRALSERALARGLASGRLTLRSEMQELVGALAERGWTITVVTASPVALVAPVAERYGIPHEAILGMRSAVGADGRYLPELAAPPTHFEGKLTALHAHHDRPPTFAAGDSWSDAPMMHAARYALLLDRGDPDLVGEARGAGWWVHRGSGGAE